MTTDSSLACTCRGMVFAALVSASAVEHAIKSIQAATTQPEMLSIPPAQPKCHPGK